MVQFGGTFGGQAFGQAIYTANKFGGRASRGRQFAFPKSFIPPNLAVTAN